MDLERLGLHWPGAALIINIFINNVIRHPLARVLPMVFMNYSTHRASSAWRGACGGGHMFIIIIIIIIIIIMISILHHSVAKKTRGDCMH